LGCTVASKDVILDDNISTRCTVPYNVDTSTVRLIKTRNQVSRDIDVKDIAGHGIQEDTIRCCYNIRSFLMYEIVRNLKTTQEYSIITEMDTVVGKVGEGIVAYTDIKSSINIHTTKTTIAAIMVEGDVSAETVVFICPRTSILTRLGIVHGVVVDIDIRGLSVVFRSSRDDSMTVAFEVVRTNINATTSICNGDAIVNIDGTRSTSSNTVEFIAVDSPVNTVPDIESVSVRELEVTVAYNEITDVEKPNPTCIGSVVIIANKLQTVDTDTRLEVYLLDFSGITSGVGAFNDRSGKGDRV